MESVVTQGRPKLRVCQDISPRDFFLYYTLENRCICRGDFYEVRSIIHKATGQEMACKIYRKSELIHGSKYPSEPTGRNLVMDELRLLSSIDHPNIVKIQEAYEDKNKIYLVIDNFKGSTLFDKIINKRQLTEHDAAAITAFLVSIIKYCHKNDLIIRNLRPESIVFEEEKGLDIKVIDMSLSIYKASIKENQHDTLYDYYQIL